VQEGEKSAIVSVLSVTVVGWGWCHGEVEQERVEQEREGTQHEAQ
jgi:hypothetical protein